MGPFLSKCLAETVFECYLFLGFSDLNAFINFLNCQLPKMQLYII